MSIGAVPTEPPPFDPEEEARLAAMKAPPVETGSNGVPIIDDAPPPATTPSPVLPSSAPPPVATPPLDVAAIAKSMTAPALAAGLPSAPPAPGAPPAAAPAAPPKTPKQTDDLRAAQTEEQKARVASDKAQVDVLAADKPAIDQRQQIADQQVKDQQNTIAERQRTQQKYDAADTAAQQQIAQTQQAIKGFKYRDYFDDGKGGTDWARKIGSSLSVALGAFGAGLAKGPNYALQILNKDMDDAHQHQVDQLGQMKDAEVSARTGLQDSQLARQKAMADLTLNDAARDKLIAAQLTQAAARQSSAEFAPSLNAAAAKLNLDAAEKDAAAKKALIDLNLKIQDESRKGHLDDASIDEKEALTKLHNVQAAAGGFAPHHGKGAGSGGGGGSVSSVGANAEGLAKAIREGKDGKPLTDDEIIHAATEFHIPLAGKAGVVTLDKVRNVAKFDADASIKAKRAGLQDERLDSKEANDWATQNGLAAINKKQRELGSLVKELKDNPNNGEAQALAVEKAVSAARGGAASKQALALALDHLGGTLDNAESVVAKIKDGTIGPGKMKNFMGFINGQVGAVQAEGKDKYDAFNKFVESQPEAKRQALLAQRGRLFSGMAGFGGTAGGGSAAHAEQPVGATKVVGGKTYRKTGPNQWELSQ